MSAVVQRLTSIASRSALVGAWHRQSSHFLVATWSTVLRIEPGSLVADLPVAIDPLLFAVLEEGAAVASTESIVPRTRILSGPSSCSALFSPSFQASCQLFEWSHERTFDCSNTSAADSVDLIGLASASRN